MITVTIDGQKTEVEKETTILKAADKLGIKIPTLCYNELIEPYAACRLCIVEVIRGKRSRLVTACNYPLRQPVEVRTNSERVMKLRRMNLELLMARAPAAKIVRELAAEMGIEKTRFTIDNPEETCILCGLCVQVCENLVGTGAISFTDRGPDRKVATPYDVTSDACILCGACAHFCPTGHIQMTDIEERILHSELTLGPNTAISIPFRQAIPNAPRINPDYCIHMKTGGCEICSQVCPKECINYDDKDEFEEIEVSAVIVATGFQDFDPAPMKQFGYGKYANVLSAGEFEQMNNAASPTSGRIVLENGEEPRSIAILHCIGSRDDNYHKYCSRVCCMYALKFAHLVKEKTEAEVYQLYIDMRAFGKGYEEFYQRLLSEGVHVIRGKGAEIIPAPPDESSEGNLLVHCEDTLISKFREIPVDMVILCTALEARKDAPELARKLNISTGADGWYIEAHPKLAPVSTTTDGIYLAGACQGPKDIPDSVAQGAAAAGHVIKILNQGELLMDAAYAVIQEEYCSGCKMCNGLCPYTAISFDEEKKVSVINAALCKACGTCVAACPSGAIVARHFTDEQIYAQIEGILV
ncbi:MAG: 4Fe-4S dicluster domain-containing protein [candidate division Zixibacteria bacterium]|nr:4Fe-4S dicluster domain-containing protein [Candidatus Tariuqbacter arcticus]